MSLTGPVSNGMRKKAIIRIRVITGIILMLALVLAVRLYQVQVMEGKAYRARAEEQYVHTVRKQFERGDIYFTPHDGEPFSAAGIQPGYLLAINPSHITDASEVYDELTRIIPLDRDEFIKRAEKKSSLYQEISPKLTDDEADAIDALDIDGVLLYRTKWRSYGGDALAARTIGFVGYDKDDIVGLYGLERYYNDVLERNEEQLTVNFFAELFGNIDAIVSGDTDERKGDVVTSIEPVVARTLDAKLEEIQKKWGSTLTGGIIINPQTGEIYALSAVPTFNLNDRSGVDLSTFSNPLVENVYEMGSIIKPLTIAAGIDSGTITPQTTYTDPGCIKLSDYTICNYDGRARGLVPMQEVLNQSLNTGVSWVVAQMGKDRFRDYFLRLKLGNETGIDLPGEVHGLIDNLQSPRELEYATASFGQGIALTPIETVRALSTLANGGRLITPHLAKEIDYEDGGKREVSFPEGEQVFSEATTETVTRMLVTVVDDALGGGTVALPHYTIAAKTGTAQIADNENGGYYDDRYLHSFFGYFPAYDPQFLIFLYTVEPKGVRYASQTLTDPFMELVTFLINYYDIPPDR